MNSFNDNTDKDNVPPVKWETIYHQSGHERIKDMLKTGRYIKKIINGQERIIDALSLLPVSYFGEPSLMEDDNEDIESQNQDIYIEISETFAKLSELFAKLAE